MPKKGGIAKRVSGRGYGRRGREAKRHQWWYLGWWKVQYAIIAVGFDAG